MFAEANKLRLFCWWSLALLVAFLLKLHYSVATADEMQWILWPLAGLTHIVSGMSFLMNDVGEWVNAEHNMVIAKSCAGVNFMILSFLVCAWRFRPVNYRFNLLVSCFGFISLSLIIAWSIAVLVNTLRILVTVQLYLHETTFLGLSAEQVHRVAGIFIFLPALWLQLSVSSRLKIFRAGTIAAGLYLSMVIGVPLVTGNYQLNTGLFAEQVFFIIGSTLIIFSVLLLIKVVNRLLRSINIKPLQRIPYTVLRPVRFIWPGR